MKQPKTSGLVAVSIRECLVYLSEADLRPGIPVEPWSSRSVRETMCDRLTRAEDELELRKSKLVIPYRNRIQSVRRRLEAELYP